MQPLGRIKPNIWSGHGEPHTAQVYQNPAIQGVINGDWYLDIDTSCLWFYSNVGDKDEDWFGPFCQQGPYPTMHFRGQVTDTKDLVNPKTGDVVVLPDGRTMVFGCTTSQPGVWSQLPAHTKPGIKDHHKLSGAQDPGTADGQILRWDAATSKWVAVNFTTDTLSDKGVPYYDASTKDFTVRPLDMEHIADGPGVGPFNDRDTLVYDQSSGQWVASPDHLGDEDNVTVAADGSSDGGVPVYDDGTDTFDVRRLSIDDLAEVAGQSPNDGDLLMYDGVKGVWFINAPVAGSGTPALTQFRGAVADVAALATITSPQNGDLAVTKDDQSLHVYGNGIWDNIGPVAAATLPNGTAVNDVLVWDGTAWQPQTPVTDHLGDEDNVTVAADGSSDGGVPVYDDGTDTFDVRRLSIDDLAEVAGQAPNDGDLLMYDGAQGVWFVNAPVAMPSVTQFRGAVADVAALAGILNPQDGDLAVTKDDQSLHVYGNKRWDNIGPAAATTLPPGNADSDVLKWDAASQSWLPVADNLGDEPNVTIPTDGSGDGGTLFYDDGNDSWDVHKISMDDIAETANANDGEFLKYDTTNGWTLSVEAPALPNGTLAGDQLSWDAAQAQWAAGRPAVPATPVANAAALPANPTDGALAVTQDDNSLYIASGGNWVKVKVDLVQNGLTPASTTKAPSVDSVVTALSGKEPSLPPHNSPGDNGKLLGHTAGGLAWVAPIAPATNTLTPVANAGALPTTGNTAGDVRVTQDDGHLHIWAGSPGSWSDIGPAAGNSLPGGGSPGNWLTANAAGTPVWAPVAQNDLNPPSASIPPTVDAVNAALTRRGVPAPTVADKDKVLTVDAAGAPVWSSQTGGNVGEIAMFTTWTVPDGWLLCDGTQFSPTTYPELYAFLGTDRTPDLRGKFVRGAQGGRNPLTTEAQATARPTTPFTTDNQGNHNHTIRIGGGGMVDAWYTQPGSYPSADSNWAGGSPAKDLAGSPMQGDAGNHSHTVTGGGDSETRPANVALVFAIRSKPIKGAKGDSAALPTGTAGQVLTWDAVKLSWQPAAPVASATELKPPVASAANLPLMGNAVGDIRVTIDDGHMHVWTLGTGGAGQWDNIGPAATSTGVPGGTLADDILTWNNTLRVWEAKRQPGIDFLSDVDTATNAPTAGMVLVFNGTTWVPQLLATASAKVWSSGAAYAVGSLVTRTADSKVLYMATTSIPNSTIDPSVDVAGNSPSWVRINPDLNAINARIAATETRITALEGRPPGTGGTGPLGASLPADPTGQPYVAPARSSQLLAIYIRSEAFPAAGSGAEFITADAVTAGKTLGIGRWDLDKKIAHGQWLGFWTTAGYISEYDGDVTIKVDNADDPSALDIVITPPTGVTFQAPQADLSYHLALPSSVNNDRSDSPANGQAAMVVTQDAQGAYHLNGGAAGMPAFAFAAGAAGIVLLIPVDAPQPLGTTITGGGTGPDLLSPAPAGDPGAAGVVWPGTRTVPPSGDQKVGRFASGDFVLRDGVGGTPRWDKLVVPPTQGTVNSMLRLDGSGGFKVGPVVDDLTNGMAVSNGFSVSWQPLPYSKAEVDTRVAPLRQIQEDLKHVPIMFKGTGPLSMADVADASKNYGMPAGTVPDPQVHHPESGDEYVDTTTQLAYGFSGHSSTSSLLRAWSARLPAGLTITSAPGGGFDLVQTATPVATTFYLFTSGTYVAGDAFTLTTLKDNVTMSYTLKPGDVGPAQVQFPAALLAAVHAAFDAKWVITPQGQYGLKFVAKDLSENQVNGAGMVAHITGKWLGNYLLSGQVGGSNNEHDKDIPPWGPSAATRVGIPDRTAKATVSAPLTITHPSVGRAHIDIPTGTDLSVPMSLTIPGSAPISATAPGTLDAYVSHRGAAQPGEALVYQGSGVWMPVGVPSKNDVAALLQGIVHGAAVQAIVTTPPTAPGTDEVWIVGTGGTGAFAGKDNQLAVWTSGAWAFSAPQANEAHLVEADNSTVHWNGTAWVKIAQQGLKVVTLTQAAYTALGAGIDPNTIYLISG